MSETLSQAVGQAIATLTANISGQVLSFKGDTFYNDDDLLGEITLDEERGKRFMSADGSRSMIMLSESRAGKRDVTFLYSEDYEQLVSWAQSRIPVVFTLEFYYLYAGQSAEFARIQRHKDCIIVGSPLPPLSREKGAYVKCSVSFGDHALVDPSTGKEI